MHLSVKGAGNEEAPVFLDNAYNEYSQNPDQQADNHRPIRRLHGAGFRGGRPGESAADRSGDQGPRVVQGNSACGQGRGADRAVEQVIEELNEDLVIVYAEDTPQNIRYFGPRDLQEAGVQKDKLRALAVENLRRIPAAARSGQMVRSSQ